MGERTDPRGHRDRRNTLRTIRLDQDSILAQLLPNQNDLLRAFDDEITPWIEWPLGHASKLHLRITTEHAHVAPEHGQ